MGGILKNIGTIAGIAAAPFTGGASLLSTLATVGSVISAVSSAQSLFKGSEKAPRQENILPAKEAPFNPLRPQEAAQPESLGAEFSAFTPEQQRSALATRGINQGLGSEEDSYYRNLIQRSLIGEGNKITNQNPDQFLLPVESQYFSRKGIDTSDTRKFLKGIR